MEHLAAERGPVGWAARVAAAPIRLYRLVVSPALPRSCRFVPSCSEYALEAVERFGPLKGFVLSARRILRCHPFHPGGFDPVSPERPPAGERCGS